MLFVSRRYRLEGFQPTNEFLKKILKIHLKLFLTYEHSWVLQVTFLQFSWQQSSEKNADCEFGSQRLIFTTIFKKKQNLVTLTADLKTFSSVSYKTKKKCPREKKSRDLADSKKIQKDLDLNNLAFSDSFRILKKIWKKKKIGKKKFEAHFSQTKLRQSSEWLVDETLLTDRNKKIRLSEPNSVSKRAELAQTL